MLITGSQLSLLPLAKHESDVVYTPDDVARDIVEFFKPSGKCLDPCLGEGAFYKYLPPGSDWCEITKGRDFFAYTKRVDWIISNPPYNIFREWMLHSFQVADNIIYLIPITKAFNSYSMMQEIHRFGGIAHIRAYGTGNSLGFPLGFAVGAVHFQRSYTGGTKTTFRK